MNQGLRAGSWSVRSNEVTVNVEPNTLPLPPAAIPDAGTHPGYLTAGLPGISGRLKVEFADFQVEEIPLYLPSGEGEHTYFAIEKQGLPTFRAIHEIARALHVPAAEIGYAGLKDAHAVARQMLSLHGVEPAAVEALELPSIKILWARRHTNKLRPGHLAGNRFTLRIREVPADALPAAREVLAVLQARGVPNHYGPQRFGRRGDTHRLGHALLRNDPAAFLQVFLGSPAATENESVQEARRRYDAGDLAGAMEMWPAQFRDERAALETLLRRGTQPQAQRRATFAVPKRVRAFFISAFQSYLFNQVVRERLDTLDRLFAGDVATKHDSGGSFIVVDPAVEQPRADRFEISPSGPMFGYKVLMAQGEPGEIEQRVLADAGVRIEDFKEVEVLKIKGERRPLRVPLGEVESWYDDGVVLRFALPAGAYATNVLAEVMKTQVESLDE